MAAATRSRSFACTMCVRKPTLVSDGASRLGLKVRGGGDSM
jgi:hypothetical protein